MLLNELKYIEDHGLIPRRQSCGSLMRDCSTTHTLRPNNGCRCWQDFTHCNARSKLSVRLCGSRHSTTSLQRMSRDFGLAQSIIYWLRSYLAGRSQIIKCHKVFSSICMVHSRVPQGSVLGPLLFLLYTSELLRIIEEHMV